MRVIIDEVDRALHAGSYYAALVTTLSLPDVCSALESASGETSGAQYKAWYEAWLSASYPQVRAVDLYSLRCGVIHQGRLGHPKMQYARILFTLPNPHGILFHRNVIADALNLDVMTFCRDMSDAVLRWYAANQNNSNVEAHLPRLVRPRPNGFPPYMFGMPLIA